MLSTNWAEGALQDGHLKAIIAPHAGLRFSGDVAARVYACMDPKHIKRVFVIGPSHHAYFKGIGLPGDRVDAYASPGGNLQLDTEVLSALRKTNKFESISMKVDEAEHSLELQLPFLAELLIAPSGESMAKLVPLIVGSVHAETEREYGQILAPYLEEEGNFFVISSDFCHWGAQFGYTRRGRSELAETYIDGPFPENASIEGLDREGMKLIGARDVEGFRDYLARSGNTICGRHPILVFLEAMKARDLDMNVEFVKYAQSSTMPGMGPPTTSSVSYACACVTPVYVPPVNAP